MDELERKGSGQRVVAIINKAAPAGLTPRLFAFHSLSGLPADLLFRFHEFNIIMRPRAFKPGPRLSPFWARGSQLLPVCSRKSPFDLSTQELIIAETIISLLLVYVHLNNATAVQ